MKTFKQLFVYSFFVLLFTNGSCVKEEIPTGNHSFSCYIDGKLFVPNGCIDCVPYSDGLHFLKYADFFSVSSYNENSDTFYFNIYDWGVGNHILKSSNGLLPPNSDSYYINHAIVIKNNIKYLSKENSGSVTFTEADIDGNTKGTFEFVLYNENDENDIIHITNGKFDD